MRVSNSHRFMMILFLCLLTVVIWDCKALNVERPEEIRSKRQVIYETDTYQKLATLWEKYNDAFPSEYAYSNWMYAARYAGVKNYSELLARGFKKYPSNPTLLYLMSLNLDRDTEKSRIRTYLEQAISIDPQAMDPWFALILVYMEAGDDEEANIALRHVLEGGVIADEILDFNYNVLIGLEPNAILVTNGDNDTYPSWILSRLLRTRTDVSVVNISLLNTDWYPVYLADHGLPRFITKDELETLRTGIVNQLKANKGPIPSPGPFSDTLVVKLIDYAQTEGRPVYFANTLFDTDVVKRYRENGRCLGMATLVTPARESYADQLKKVYTTWLKEFRTGGLDSWRLHAAKPSDGGRNLVPNYALSPLTTMDTLKSVKPDLRGDLFQWYKKHVESLLSADTRNRINIEWCKQKDVAGVQAECDKLDQSR